MNRKVGARRSGTSCVGVPAPRVRGKTSISYLWTEKRPKIRVHSGTSQGPYLIGVTDQEAASSSTPSSGPRSCPQSRDRAPLQYDLPPFPSYPRSQEIPKPQPFSQFTHPTSASTAHAATQRHPTQSAAPPCPRRPRIFHASFYAASASSSAPNLQVAPLWHITVHTNSRNHTCKDSAEAECSAKHSPTKRHVRRAGRLLPACSISFLSPFPSHIPRQPRNTSPETAYDTADSKTSKACPTNDILSPHHNETDSPRKRTS
jgi:hypothetical protein